MTLRLNFPGYLDGEHGLTGEVPWPDMVERMLPFWKNGIQIHSHANGDETVDMTLNTLNAMQNIAPRFDHRFTIEHYCISTPAQAKRLAHLFLHFRLVVALVVQIRHFQTEQRREDVVPVTVKWRR